MNIAAYDIVAFVWFWAAWIGYTVYADHVGHKGLTLLTVMKRHRAGWMHQMLHRDVRIVDSTILASLMRSVSLFSSTTLLILAGLLAILGSVDKVQAVVQDLPYVAETPRGTWELKILTLILIFIYTFFKFAWSLRQFNYSNILLGAAPPPREADSDHAKVYAASMADVISLAVGNFNRGMRAYYFALAALSWFLHPALFAVATLWVVAVIYRREFRSQTLGLLDQAPRTDRTPDIPDEA